MLSDKDFIGLIRSALTLPADFAFDGGTAPDSIPGWDSVGWLRIVAALDEALGFEVPLDVFDNVERLDDLFGALSSLKRP
jgi:hypothetical protein